MEDLALVLVMVALIEAILFFARQLRAMAEAERRHTDELIEALENGDLRDD
jgi:hypothetical protein